MLGIFVTGNESTILFSKLDRSSATQSVTKGHLKQVTTVENNASVVAAARAYFGFTGHAIVQDAQKSLGDFAQQGKQYLSTSAITQRIQSSWLHQESL